MKALSRTISFDRVVDIYDETRKLPDDVMAKVVDGLVAALERHGCRKILDIGVGTGRFAGPLQLRGLEVHGIDVSRQMLNKARAKAVANLSQGDMRRLPFKDKTFDAATAMHVLHLVREWRDALAEIARVARFGIFSAVSIPTSQEGPTYSYRRMLLESNWPEIQQGIHERDLIQVMPPTESETVASFIEEKDADEVLGNLERRIYSFQWEVPEETHRKIMTRLRVESSGTTISTARQLKVCYWDAGLL